MATRKDSVIEGDASIEEIVIEDGASRSITPTMLAESLGCDAKRLRSFIRTITPNRAGRGGAWRFTQAEADAIAKGWANKGALRATAPAFNAEFLASIGVDQPAAD